MDQRTAGEGFHGAHADTAPTTPSSERKSPKFSEMAKQSTLMMLKEMVRGIEQDGFIQAWPSFESMTRFHAETQSGLIDDPEVMEYVNQLVDKLRLRSDARSQDHLYFIEDHYLVEPMAEA